MVSTNVLTSEQGLRILLEILIFFVLYFIYLRITSNDAGFANLIITTAFFALWLVTVTVAGNMALAFSVETPRNANLQHY